MKNFCLAILIIFLFACGEVEKPHESAKVFRFNYFSEVSSLDPAFARMQANIWGVSQLFDGLVQLNEKLEILPAIAKKWTISDDGLVYTFYLRTDVFFHTSPAFPEGKGRGVVAEDFVYSFNRIIDPKVASPGGWIFNDKVDTLQPFKAVNDSVFQIKLYKPFPPFLGILTMQYCSVVPKEAVEYYKADFGRNPVGTGPFKFKIWQQGIMLSFVRNENYFEKDGQGNRLPYLDAVQMSFMENRSAEFLKFTNGELDFVSQIDGSFKDEVLTLDGTLQPKYAGKMKFYRVPNLNLAYIGILVDPFSPVMNNNPLKLKAIRKAINMGFDRAKMMKYLYNSIGIPAIGGIIPPGLPSFDTSVVKGYAFSPEEAGKLLREAGFPNGKGLPEIKLFFTNDRLNHVSFIQSQLASIGIKVKLETVVPAFLREALSKYQVSFFTANWTADYPDEENFLALFYSKNPAPPNYTHFQHSEFDKLYELALKESNHKRRIMYYQQMDKIVMEEAPVVPMYYDEVVLFTQNYVEGLVPNSLNLLLLKRVKMNR